jgi:hypothetical protein
MKKALLFFGFIYTLFKFSAGCAAPGEDDIPADHFEVRFSTLNEDKNRMVIGETEDAIVIDSGWFNSYSSPTEFFSSLAGEYIIFSDVLNAWTECGQFIFKAQKKYEIELDGAITIIIHVLPD